MDYENKPNVLVKFWHFITFRTYGNQLLTAGGAGYLTLMFAIVSLVAFSEGVAWGYFGTSFTPENPLLGGISLGLFVFLILWFFDKTMATQDLLVNEHAYTLEGEEKPNSAWSKYNIGTYFIFLVRLAIVIGSLYLTSDYLTQFIFRSDIDKEMQLQYKQNIETAKNTIIGNFDDKIAQEEMYLKSLHDKLQKEIGGKRGSGYGKGEVAKSIEQELNVFQSNLNALKVERQNSENTLNTAIKNNDVQTLKTFGIEAVKDSPIFRQQAIDKFSQDPAFLKRKHTIEGFLTMLGIILIAMKILQPKTLKLYYSERLQEMWINYQEGHYDDYLPNRDKSFNVTKRPMPQTFEGIMIGYAKHKDFYEQEEREQKRKALTEQQKQKEQAKLLEQSQQEWAENKAKELQGLEYEQKRRHHLKEQIDRNKVIIKEQLTEFVENNSEKINELKSEREKVLAEISDATRMYQSKQEDINARQERLDNAKHQLATLQAIAINLEKKENKNVESVRSYSYVQTAIAEQKQVIKNLQDNWLTFDRDMNFYAQKIDNLNDKKFEIEQELLFFKTEYDALRKAYQECKLAELELLGEIDLNTPYLKGTAGEIPHIAEKIKNNQEHYFYVNENKSDNIKIGYKDE